jgi:hypothetical protein
VTLFGAGTLAVAGPDGTVRIDLSGVAPGVALAAYLRLETRPRPTADWSLQGLLHGQRRVICRHDHARPGRRTRGRSSVPAHVGRVWPGTRQRNREGAGPNRCRHRAMADARDRTGGSNLRAGADRSGAVDGGARPAPAQARCKAASPGGTHHSGPPVARSDDRGHGEPDPPAPDPAAGARVPARVGAAAHLELPPDRPLRHRSGMAFAAPSRTRPISPAIEGNAPAAAVRRSSTRRTTRLGTRSNAASIASKGTAPWPRGTTNARSATRQPSS